MATDIHLTLPIDTPDQVVQAKLRLALEHIRSRWWQAVSGIVLPGMPYAVHDPAYAKALAKAKMRIIRTTPYTWQASLRVKAPPSAGQWDGTPARDLKPALLNGPKSRPLKSGQGRYNVIPFGHAASEVPSEALEQPAGVISLDDAWETMGRRSKVAALVDPSGVAMNQGTVPAANPKGYTWKHGPLSGLTKTGQGQFMTWRTVSTPRFDGKGRFLGSDANSWILPARPSAHLLDAVVAAATPGVEMILEP